MKFVCSRCSQKHSLNNDLLAGKKVVRVNCRRCGQRIALRAAPTESVENTQTGEDSILFTWKTFAKTPLTRLTAMPARPRRRKTPPPPPTSRRATPPPVPVRTMPTIDIPAQLKDEPSIVVEPVVMAPADPEPVLLSANLLSDVPSAVRSAVRSKPAPLPPELPAEASQPAGVTSGLLDMLTIADGYFSEEVIAPAVPVQDEPDFTTFAPNPYDRTLQIVLPEAPTKSRTGWKYAAAGVLGAAAAVAATFVALTYERPSTAGFAATAQAVGQYHNVGSDNGSPQPGSDEWTEWTDDNKEPVEDIDNTDSTDNTDNTSRKTPTVRRQPRPTLTVRTEPKPPVVRPRPTHKQHVVWDEVECMLADNPPAECKPFLKGHDRTATKTPAADKATHKTLSRNLINAGIAAVRWRVDQCGTRGWGAGQVTVALTVNKAGVVTGALISSAPNSSLAACVKERVQMARFAKTRTGGSFSYLFSFR